MSVTYQLDFSTILIEHIPARVVDLVVADTQWAQARILDRQANRSLNLQASIGEFLRVPSSSIYEVFSLSTARWRTMGTNSWKLTLECPFG